MKNKEFIKFLESNKVEDIKLDNEQSYLDCIKFYLSTLPIYAMEDVNAKHKIFERFEIMPSKDENQLQFTKIAFNGLKNRLKEFKQFMNVE